MILPLLLIVPLIGIFIILVTTDYSLNYESIEYIKWIALSTSLTNLFVSLILFILFDFSTNQFQFVQEYYEINSFDFYLGVDGLSIYFVLLTTLIIPIALLSNWSSILENIKYYVIIVLLLETLLLAVFLMLDILLFYIFFESILPPLFILIGLFGSSNRVRASFYLFLYTLLGSLFLLLSILAMSSIMGTTDFDALYKTNFDYSKQLFLFYGIFIAFAVKTPTIFLNTWLLKAHVESPLGGSIILAGIVLKLSLYGILRLILPILPKASIDYTYIVYLIGVITIVYASFSTLRTIDIKELIAYSSVSHAAVYLLGVLSNSIQGIEGGITLGLAHGFVSSGLFICAGGILYDRSSTRLITFYKGMTQVMPLFALLFFILSLGNCGAPLTLNFLGEFMSLYGVFERLPLLGVFASSSIVFSAAYTIYMFNRIAFGGSYSRFFKVNIPDLNKREFYILFPLVLFTVIFGVYPAVILDGLHYSVSTLIYYYPAFSVNCDGPMAWALYCQDSGNPWIVELGLQDNIMFYIIMVIAYISLIPLLLVKTLFNVEWDLQRLAKPHAFTTLYLENSPLGLYRIFLPVFSQFRRFILSKLYSKFIMFIYNKFLGILETKYKVAYYFLMFIHSVYSNIDKLLFTHNGLCFLLLFGLFLESPYLYYKTFILMYFVHLCKEYLNCDKEILANYFYTRLLIGIILDGLKMYLLGELLLTITNTLWFNLTKLGSYILKMDSSGNNNGNQNSNFNGGGSNNNQPNNGPNENTVSAGPNKRKRKARSELSQEELDRVRARQREYQKRRRTENPQPVPCPHNFVGECPRCIRDMLECRHAWMPSQKDVAFYGSACDVKSPRCWGSVGILGRYCDHCFALVCQGCNNSIPGPIPRR